MWSLFRLAMVSQLGIDYSTKAMDLKNFISNNESNDIVIFSTYQSLQIVGEALENIKFSFDLAFFDEAHKTAGPDKKKFNICFKEDFIRSDKRLYMTATERIISPKLRDKLDVTNFDYYSMDDSNLYGKTFEEFGFSEAIKSKSISDYEIYILFLPSDFPQDQLTKYSMKSGNFLIKCINYYC